MYYWKTYYEDGTWDCLRTKTFITNAKQQVCPTCRYVARKSLLWYLWAVITGWIEGQK